MHEQNIRKCKVAPKYLYNIFFTWNLNENILEENFQGNIIQDLSRHSNYSLPTKTYISVMIFLLFSFDFFRHSSFIREIHFFARAKTKLCMSVLYLSHTLLCIARKKEKERDCVINPNPFNMQISPPPTQPEVCTYFLFFFSHQYERVSIADVIHTAATARVTPFLVEYVIIFIFPLCSSSRAVMYYIYLHSCKCMKI